MAIPVIIHFWHQKRGTVIEWAAMQWLVEKNQQQQRGLKFDNLWLLLLRALLVVLTAGLLAKPVFDGLTKAKSVPTVHVVQPNALLTTTFRFELEQALQKGEPIYWTTAPTEPIATLDLPRQPAPFTTLGLQSAINQVSRREVNLHLYIVNSDQLAHLPTISVPTRFRLHTLVDSARAPRPYLTANQTKLFVNGAGRLTNGPVLPTTVRFASAPAHEGTLSVLIRFRDKTERQTVRAALDALTDVYKPDLTVADQPVPTTHYDVVLSDDAPSNPSPKTLYIVSGVAPAVQTANVIAANTGFGPASDLVKSGQLPEWLGDRLVASFGLNTAPRTLSQQQLNALFVPVDRPANKPADDASSATVHGGLLLALILLIGLERGLALTKNA